MIITDKKQLERFYSCHRVWQGIPGIERTPKGRTFISLYSGDTKETFGNYIALLKSETDSDFGEPILAIQKEGKFRCFDPVLWIDPLGRLWIIWSVMPGEQVFGCICENPDAENLVWGEEFYIGRGIMMNKPTVLSSGEWLFPIAVWKLDIYREIRKPYYTEDEQSAAFAYKTSDNGKTFVRLGGKDVPDRSCDEHMFLELDNGMIKMFVRTGYGIAVSNSYDRGVNWSHGSDSGIKGPNSRFFIAKLRSGRVLMVNHYNFSGRNNMAAFLSEDEGKTFPHVLMLDERDYVSYPDAVEGNDGYIYITYDRERGVAKTSLEMAYADAREILTAKITEQDIIDGKLNSEKGFLKNVVSKLDKLSPEDPNPFRDTPEAILKMAEELIENGGEDIIEKVFERYPINCINICDYDAKQLDSLIKKFKQTGCKDVHVLVEIVDFVQRSPGKKKEIYPIIDKVKEFVVEHLEDDISVAQIAENMRVSEYYLLHLFKAVTGTTIISFRNEYRLMRAKRMLIETDETISDIAQQVGFCTSAYFTEIFSRSEGIPPTEYRKYHK